MPMPTARITAQRRLARRLPSAQITPTTTYPSVGRRYISTLSGEPVTSVPLLPASPAEAESLPVFGRGVELLASAVAGTSWYSYRWDVDNGVFVRLPDQPNIVTDPDPETNAWQWKYAATVDLVEYGNHISLYGQPDSDNSYYPGWLTPVPIDLVGIVTDPGSPGWWRWSVGGQLFDPSEVLHISAGNRSGEILGRGAVRQYADMLGQVYAAEQYSGKWFAGGGLPPGIIQMSPQPPQAMLDAFKQRWREMALTGEPVALPANVTVTPLISDADKAQLVESRTWNAQLTAIALGIPSYYLGLPGNSMTYSNVESVDIGWVRDSVDRWAQPITAAFTKHLLPRGQVLRMDWASRMRTDTSTQVEYVSGLKAAGIITVDEARAVIGRPPLVTVDEAGTTPAGVPELTPAEVTG